MPYFRSIAGRFHLRMMMLDYCATVQSVADGIATVYVHKNRTGRTGIQSMSIEHLNVIKNMDGYRIEYPIDFETIDLESLLGVSDLYEHRIDGFHISINDADKLGDIMTSLELI